jgi:phosphonate transport system permease protein
MSLGDVSRPSPVGIRMGIVLSLGVAGVAAYLQMNLSLSELLPSEGGMQVAWKFLSRAFTPAFTSEARFVPADAPPLLATAAQAAWTTLVTGSAAMSVALPMGIVLGFGASTAWWAGDRPDTASKGFYAGMTRALPLAICTACRLLVALMRSVHELLWAVLLLAAVGLNGLAAVIALAIPTTGILAKVFAELVDEAPRDAMGALRGAGASGFQTYCFALLPRAAPDLIAYSFYRFECVLRSSAVLGFFGFPTLGLYIRQSFDSTNYGEVWTYLYALLALVIAFDLWSGAVRRRLLA